MKAPEKIYMPNELLSEEWTRHIEGEDVEYIRTDAFIEKAKKWFEEHFGNRLKWEITTYEFEDMQSMVKDFRNYMKGE